jgi:hypothetical protein
VTSPPPPENKANLVAGLREGRGHRYLLGKSSSKSKICPATDHDGPEEEYRYTSTLSLTLALHGGGWSRPRPGRFTPEKGSVPIVQQVWWAPDSVWTGAENLVPTGIRSPDFSARSKSLFRLSYPGERTSWAAGAKLFMMLDRWQNHCIAYIIQLHIINYIP